MNNAAPPPSWMIPYVTLNSRTGERGEGWQCLLCDWFYPVGSTHKHSDEEHKIHARKGYGIFADLLR